MAISPAVHLWRNRDFMLLWGGQGVSLLGSMLSGIALPFLVFRLGYGAGVAGFVLALSSLPFVFLALPAGALLDRWNRKRIMILCDCGRGMAMGSIALALVLGQLTLAHICLSALVAGACYVFFSIAETASLAQVVTQDALSRATSYNQALFSSALLVGPLLGGALFGINPLLPFALDALSFVVSIVSLQWIKVSFQQTRAPVARHLGRDIAEGVRWLWRWPALRFITLLGFAVNVVLGGSVLVIIDLVAHTLPGMTSARLPAYTGALMTIAGIGGILGAIASTQVGRFLRWNRIVMGALWAQGALLTLLILAPNFATLAALIVGSYCIWPSYNAALAGYRLASIPDALQGRVNAAHRLALYAADPLGAGIVGFALAHAGIVATALARGLLFLGIALVATALPWRETQ